MALQIDRDTTLNLIEMKFGSIDNLVVDWEEKVRSDKYKSKSKDRSTIYRWLEKGLPSGKDALFGFCGMLDVDPIAILDLDRSGLLQDFGKLRRSFQLGLMSTSSFRSLWDIYFPGPQWPSDSIANTYYGRPWYTHEIEHAAGEIINEYALLELTFDEDIADYQPIAFHIAYRRKSAKDDMWRPYGSIVKNGTTTRLISESGDFQEKLCKGPTNMVRAETYFGPGPAEFKLASLHKFKLTIKFPSSASDVVRFHA